jgi:hypothetical protein
LLRHLHTFRFFGSCNLVLLRINFLTFFNDQIILSSVVSQLGFDTPHNFVDSLVELFEQFTRVEWDFRRVSILDQLVIVRLLSLKQLSNLGINVNKLSVVFAIVQVNQHVRQFVLQCFLQILCRRILELRIRRIRLRIVLSLLRLRMRAVVSGIWTVVLRLHGLPVGVLFVNVTAFFLLVIALIVFLICL